MNATATDITSDDVKKFRELYRNRLGRTIDKKTAYRKLSLLVRQMELVYRPITKEQSVAIKNEDDYYYEPSRPESDK